MVPRVRGNLQNTSLPCPTVCGARLLSKNWGISRYRSCEHAMHPVLSSTRCNPCSPPTHSNLTLQPGRYRSRDRHNTCAWGGGDYSLLQRMKWTNTLLEDASSLMILAWWSNPSSSSRTVTCPAPKVHHSLNAVASLKVYRYGSSGCLLSVSSWV